MYNFFKIKIDKNRVFGLDILRTIAVCMVTYQHAGALFLQNYLHLYHKIVFDGVSIFFVLSGFLIGSILIKQIEKRSFTFKELLTFWQKRWSRTLPNYYLFLTIAIILYFIRDTTTPINFYEYILFLQNLAHRPSKYFSISWSLSVEEWFYLTIPLLVFLLLKFLKTTPKKSVFITIITIIIFGIVIRYHYLSSGNNIIDDLHFSVLYRIDSIVYGVLGAYVYHYYKDFWGKYKYHFLMLGIAGVSLYFTPVSNKFYNYVLSYSLTSITVLCFLPFLNNIKTSNSKLYKPITYISLISYSTYLIHMLVIDLILYIDNWEFGIHLVNNYDLPWSALKLFYYILFWIITILLSIINYKYFEVPTTNYLRKFIK
ncbi:hypothetical protein BPO_1784 [Bergeyella porcorum]|uniref:Acyltransferase 3 domain-containing protein n=1 Tax=Bergeyella porcorum TaxID=1735111 RepID=A0AAU0F262_9FLAO